MRAALLATRGGHSGGGGGGGGGTSYQPYIATSAINQPIPVPAPVHPSSSTMISASNNWLLGGTSNDAFKEWLGPRQRVLYWRGDTSTLTTVPIYVNWVSGTGYVCASTPKMNVPMPSWFASILSGSSYADADHVVSIVDSVTGNVWESYRVTPPGVASINVVCSTSRWNAIEANLWLADTVSHNGYDGSISPSSPESASKIHQAAGNLVPEDFADLTIGSFIPHALRVECACGSNGTPYPKYVLPARSGDGQHAGGIPYGARVQLDPSLDVATWPSVTAKTDPWKSALIKILKTLQIYGFFICDGGGPGAGGFEAGNAAGVFQGTYNGGTGYKYPWEVAGYGWSYANGIPYDLMSHFRVIDWGSWTGA